MVDIVALTRPPCPGRTASWASTAIFRLCACLCLACFASATSPVRAEVSIDLPEITLLPNTPHQAFDVFVRNTGPTLQVIGVGFNIQVADGGPPLGGKTNGPAIASVDVFAGTVFESNNNGSSGAGSIVPQLYERGTLTASNTVGLPNGLSKIATVVLDTTGFSSGTFSLTLNTRNGRTKYPSFDGDFFPVLIDGTVTVAPPAFVTSIALPKPSRVELKFSTTSGLRYRAQRAPDIASGDWTNVPHSLALDDPLILQSRQGTGDIQTIFVESLPGPGAFYRMIMERAEP